MVLTSHMVDGSHSRVQVTTVIRAHSGVNQSMVVTVAMEHVLYS